MNFIDCKVVTMLQAAGSAGLPAVRLPVSERDLARLVTAGLIRKSRTIDPSGVTRYHAC